MPTSANDLVGARAVDVSIANDELTVQLEDGRTVAVPLVWYPRLLHGTRRERARWRLIGRGVGIHWPLLDEDIRVDGLLAGRRSGESSSHSSAGSRVARRPGRTSACSRRRAERAAADTQRSADFPARC
jgi:hypothetical protein